MSQEVLDELVRRFNETAPIARLFGMRLSFDEEGQALIDLPYNPDLNHTLGAVHGGVYATMLDVAGWFTAAATRDGYSWIATSELTVHLLRPAVQTSLRAVGRMVKGGKRQDVVEMYLYDGEGNLVGHGVGTFVVLPEVSMG